MNHAASSALPLSAATRQPQQLRLSVWRRKISCACGGGLLSFNCCRCFCCCCCSLVGAFVCVCFCFLLSMPYGLTIECSGYVCVGVWVCVFVCTWSVPWQLGTQTYLCGYVLLHIFSKFYNSQVHARQAGRQAGSENSAPTRSCLICIQRTLPHTYTHSYCIQLQEWQITFDTWCHNVPSVNFIS